MILTALALVAATSLQCTIDELGKARRLDLDVNEARGSVGLLWTDTGSASEARATFTPGAVSFGPFTVDRRTLALQRVNDEVLRRAGAASVSVGQCKVVTPERAF